MWRIYVHLSTTHVVSAQPFTDQVCDDHQMAIINQDVVVELHDDPIRCITTEVDVEALHCAHDGQLVGNDPQLRVQRALLTQVGLREEARLVVLLGRADTEPVPVLSLHSEDAGGVHKTNTGAQCGLPVVIWRN